MTGLTRRQLLKAGAGAGVAALAADPLLHSALAMKLPPGELNDIEHVVILIQENRSFDHYFGLLPGRPRLRGQIGPAKHLRTARLPRRRLRRGAAARSTPREPTPAGRPVLPGHHTLVGAPARILERRRDGPLRRSSPRQRRAWKPGPATMSLLRTRRTSPSTTPWPKTTRSVTTTTARCSGPPTRTGCTRCRATIDPNGENGGPLVETLVEFDTLRGRFTMADDARGAHRRGRQLEGLHRSGSGIRGQRAGVLQKLPEQRKTEKPRHSNPNIRRT